MSLKKYQICEFRKVGSSAWGKAPSDVASIAEQMGYCRINLTRIAADTKAGRFLSVCTWTLKAIASYLRIQSGSVLLLQHPCHAFSGSLGKKFLHLLLYRKHLHLVTLVHDLGEIQQGLVENESTYTIPPLLLSSQVIIAHNDSMRKYLIKHGAGDKKIVTLECFDYLVKNNPCTTDITTRKGIAIAGSYGHGKSTYIYELARLPDLQFECFGIGFDHSRCKGKNLNYHGAFLADDPPSMASYKFGLVWEGDSIDCLNGTIGRYYKIVNPHKLSMFLASDLPVIANREAAIADYVIKNKIGFVVDAIRDINQAADPTAYKEMLENTARIGRMLRSGTYTRAALAASEKSIFEMESHICK